MGEYKPLPIGVDDFKDIITKEYYYVDKTLFMKELLDKKGVVNLFMRPRRFGKTLSLSMVKYYFEKAYDFQGNAIDNSYLFEKLKISQAGSAYQHESGQYPVIFLTFKSAKQQDFKMAYVMIARELAEEFKRHSHILKSTRLLETEKKRYRDICAETAEPAQIYDAVRFLSECLYKVHEKKVIILIDEYDVPLESAYLSGFYDDMAGFIWTLLESALKTNPYLEFSVITGCLRISKESIFTGLNNLNVISILSDLYSEYFGFSKQEVEEALRFYDREDKIEIVRKWYDGYWFGKSEVYNPWSVMKYIQDIVENEHFFPRPYWANTSSNDIVRTLVEKADISAKRELERLIEGGSVEKTIHEEITYDEIEKSDDNLWNFLFFTGYLKKSGDVSEGRNIRLKLAIPDEEVKYIYENIIMDWFRKEIKKEDLSHLYKAFEQEDCKTAEEVIGSQLLKTISFYDYAENFYHGFMLGMLSQASDYIVKSNREAGNGRTDITMCTPSRKGMAIILEIKIAESFKGLEEVCSAGLKQMEERGYAEEFYRDGYENVKKYAIGFYKKDCEVKKMEFKGE